MYNLVEFGDYLSERELVQENRIPFFVKWVRWYLSSGAGDAEEFSNFLIAYGKAEWQVRQALDQSTNGSNSMPLSDHVLVFPDFLR